MLKVFFTLCFLSYIVNCLKLPGPLVYVVTPSSRSVLQIDEARSAPAPFYYHNWIRRMDPPENLTTSTTITPKVDTPDLIFAEFEKDHGDDMKKSIRKLLEKERVEMKTSSTTPTPIFVPDNHEIPPENETTEKTINSAVDNPDMSVMYNNLFNINYKHADSFIPTVRPSSSSTDKTLSTVPIKVENIWHVIDSEKYNKNAKWEELPIGSGSYESNTNTKIGYNENEFDEDPNKTNDNDENGSHERNEDNNKIDEHFTLSGFATNPVNGGENESRAIRTEPNVRFPYINLKPFQMKVNNKPVLNSKKGNNMLNLDKFKEIKSPVRGEIQDIMPIRQPIDRYNPAQPYLPFQGSGSQSKQSNQNSKATKTVSNLVPPPPPPPPKISGNDFPAPTIYESFPPYIDNTAPAPPVAAPPVISYQPPGMSDDLESDPLPDSDDSDSNGPPMDFGYKYKKPAVDNSYKNSKPQLESGYKYNKPQAPSLHFTPTLPPVSKPFKGYSYEKPSNADDIPLDTDDTPPSHGYHYKNPTADHQPSYGYDHHAPVHDDHDDYPELIFQKPYGNKGSDSMKGGDDMGMVPPPPPPPNMKPSMDAGPPSDDHGYSHDYPPDFKYHDFEEHDDHHHYYHHHKTTTTTTTTTEMPRVNRYSYYYLGKKLYYLPLYFSVYFIAYVGALIIKAILRHKIVYPNSWRPNDQTAGFFSKRSVNSWNLSNDKLHELTTKVTEAISSAADKYINKKPE